MGRYSKNFDIVFCIDVDFLWKSGTFFFKWHFKTVDLEEEKDLKD